MEDDAHLPAVPVNHDQLPDYTETSFLEQCQGTGEEWRVIQAESLVLIQSRVLIRGLSYCRQFGPPLPPPTQLSEEGLFNFNQTVTTGCL